MAEVYRIKTQRLDKAERRPSGWRREREPRGRAGSAQQLRGTNATPARSQVPKRSGPINQKVYLRTRKQLQPFGTAQIDEGEERQAWLRSTKPLPVLRFTGSGGALICSSRFASAVIVPFFSSFPLVFSQF